MPIELKVSRSAAAAARNAVMGRVGLCCIAASLFFDCSEAGVMGVAGKLDAGDGKKGAESSTSTDTETGSDEAVWINGSYLTCSWLEVSDANDVTAACRMLSSSGAARPPGLDFACSAQDAATGAALGQTILKPDLAFHVKLHAQQIGSARLACQVSGHDAVTSKTETLVSVLAGANSAELLACLTNDAVGSARDCVAKAGIPLGTEPADDGAGNTGSGIEEGDTPTSKSTSVATANGTDDESSPAAAPDAGSSAGSGPPAPTNLNLSASNFGVLNWTAAGGSTTGYKIFYKQNDTQQTFPSDCTTSPGELGYTSVTAGNVTAYDLTGLTDCMSAWMSLLVCSYDDANNYSVATGTTHSAMSNVCAD